MGGELLSLHVLPRRIEILSGTASPLAHGLRYPFSVRTFHDIGTGRREAPFNLAGDMAARGASVLCGRRICLNLVRQDGTVRNVLEQG